MRQLQVFDMTGPDGLARFIRKLNQERDAWIYWPEASCPDIPESWPEFPTLNLELPEVPE